MAKKSATPPAEPVPGLVLVALTPISHDGDGYAEGETLPEMPADQAQALIDLGAAKLAD